MANPSTVKTIMSDWTAKAKAEGNDFNKFISYWIAFNAYYVSATGEQTDRDAIAKIKTHPDLIAFYVSIKDSKIISDFAVKSPIINTKNGDQLIIDAQSFESIISSIYQVRNNLFHGSKSEHVERDKELVSTAIPILGHLVKFCQDNFDTLDF